MINIQKIDHIGIRIRNKNRAVAFYETLGFKLTRDPSSNNKDENILIDTDVKYAGYTHIALRVDSIAQTENIFKKYKYEITGRMKFEKMQAIFIRDPDKNVIEFNEYA